MKIVVGTRGSALALAQTCLVEDALRRASPHIEIERRVVSTTGDQRLDISLRDALAEKIPQGLFVREIEELLARGEIDIAVHSLKDLPTTLPEGLRIGACLERAPVGDVLITKQPGTLDSAPRGAVVATSSPRRIAQLKSARSDIEVVDIRGNVPTRISKLVKNADWHGIVLARAGLERLAILSPSAARLEWEGVRLYVQDLPLQSFLPAPGQGAIAIEVRENDPATADIVAAINHVATFDSVAIERAWLAGMGGGCHVPMAAYARPAKNGYVLTAANYTEAQVLTAEATGATITLGETLAQAMQRPLI
jgi:hydroxymethylbilane synthase